MFKKLIRYHKNSDYLPKKVKDRLELGPRMATLSYKTSGKPRAKHTAFKDWGPVLKKKEEDVNFMDEFIKGINHAHESSELYKQGKRVIPLRRF